MSNHGYSDIVIGLQYGDEGKARIVDMIAEEYDIIARFNGGANAGHTVETKDGGKVALNQVPSGIFYPEKILYTGSGCVVNFEKLAVEIEKIEKIGISLDGRFKISPQASVIQPHHVIIDSMTGQSLGTTRNGIGPAYADRANRMIIDRLTNIRVGDLNDNPEHYFTKVRDNLVFAVQIGKLEIDIDDEMNKMQNAFEKVKKYIEVDPLYLQKQVEAGKNVLFEGAQAVMLDVTKGSVPYVTSSNTIAAAAYTGGDLSPQYHRKTIGVAKAIMSRVGYGPFPSEFGGKKSEEHCMAQDEGKPKYGRQVEEECDLEKHLSSGDEFQMGVALRILSGEYGVVSTRPRRVGALDLVQLNYAIKMNGVTELAINKFDLLKEYSRTAKGQVPLVTSYKLNEKEIDYMPASTSTYYETEAIYDYHEGSDQDLSTMTSPSELPSEMQDLVTYIEKATGTKMFGIGVGPERNQFVKF